MLCFCFTLVCVLCCCFPLVCCVFVFHIVVFPMPPDPSHLLAAEEPSVSWSRLWGLATPCKYTGSWILVLVKLLMIRTCLTPSSVQTTGLLIAAGDLSGSQCFLLHPIINVCQPFHLRLELSAWRKGHILRNNIWHQNIRSAAACPKGIHRDLRGSAFTLIRVRKQTLIHL